MAEKLLAAGAAVGATDGVRGPRAGEGVAGGVCQHRFRAGSVLVSPFFPGGGRARVDGSSRGAGRRAQAGAHRAAPGQNGNTPLHWAAYKGHVEVAEKLLAAGAAVGATDNVRAPRAGEGVAGGFTIVICCQPLFRFLFSFCSCFSGGREGGRISCCVAGEGQQGGAGRGARGGRSPRGPRAGRRHAAALGCDQRSRGGGGEAARGGRGRRRHGRRARPSRGGGGRRGVYNSDLLSASF